jgi:CubicO group peptidase (beta-lactamase class C family)
MRTVRKLVAALAAVAGFAGAAALAHPADAAASSPTTVAPALTRADLEAWLDGMLPYALKRGDVAGAVVAVVKDGQPLLVKGYGYADVATGKPVDADLTLFRPGSVTKLFTWTAVMQLVGEGKIDLDRDVNAYLDFRIPVRADGPITMRRLMTHSAGFEETIGNLASRDASSMQPLGVTLKRWIPARIYPAGATPAYSNYGAALAGYIVQRVSGQPFDAYVEQQIFRPLAMDHSTMRQPPPGALRALMSTGYRTASEPAKPYEFIGVPPAGAAASSGADMARFMIAQLQDERGAGLLLKPETARLMHRTYAPGLGPLNRMTLGFFESNLNGRRIISHAGDTQWFHSELDLFLDDGVGLYFSANSAGKDAAAQQIRTELLQAFADRYFSGPQPQGPVDPATARAHAAMIAGVYESSRRSASNFMSLATLLGAMPVKADQDGTISTPHILALDGQPRRWREIAPFVWKDTAGPWRLAAEVRDGRVVRFSTDQFSPIMMFEPAPWWRGAWLAPALQAGLAALALTTLLWPLAALARRKYRAPFALQGRDAWAYRGARLACIASLTVAAGWMLIIGAGVQDLALFSGTLNPWIMALGLAGPAALAAALAATMWNAWRVWRRTRGWSAWFARLWSIILVLGVVTVCWSAAAFHLFGPNAHF